MKKTSEIKKLIETRSNFKNISTIWVGIDIGSTTVKIAAIDPETRKVIFWRYARHNASQAASICGLLEELHEELPDVNIKIAACGSGAEPIVDIIGGSFVQEVIATSIAIRKLYPHIRTAIELGGQDAKIMVFRQENPEAISRLVDMRMNGSCAGGTGAFIDQMAVILGIAIEDFNELAAKGGKVYSISGRCGVFAKSDILPLINLGVPVEDIALSVFHAVANQTICSLAQGIDITNPVAFMGGPFSFNPVLINAFLDKLNITGEQAFKPEHSQIMAAIGAAISIGELHNGSVKAYSGIRQLKICRKYISGADNPASEPFFHSASECQAFNERHLPPVFTPVFPEAGTTLETYIGIDAGSTTLKIVFIDNAGNVINKWYTHNSGDTIETARSALLTIWKEYSDKGVNLFIKGIGSTGYGENLCAQAFGADYHNVETVAHAFAALRHFPDATFVLDIGGQDMKAMKIDNGIISEVYLNEACSSGCGSFIEATARSLGIPVDEISAVAFKADNPASLGSRCTVFMLSSVTTEQKNGKSKEDIVAGLCRSIVGNIFSKVIRVSDVNKLGNKIVVQGGTFKNDAILRAFEQYAGKPVYRAPYCGEMGAYGIALLTKQTMEAAKEAPASNFIGFESLRTIGYANVTQDTCSKCSNHCNRNIIKFSTGVIFCSGNRCEKGNISSAGQYTHSNPAEPEAKPGTLFRQPQLDRETRSQTGRPAFKEYPTRLPGFHRHIYAENVDNSATVTNIAARTEPVASMAKFKENLLLNFKADLPRILPDNGISIGIPLVFEFWNSLPFWKALFTTLGFNVSVSGRSNAEMAEKGNRFAPSDSICFPAKLMHGHIETLITGKVDRIFAPAIKTMSCHKGNSTSINMCPIIQGLPILVSHLNRPPERAGIPVDSPVFAWHSNKMRDSQIVNFFRTVYEIPAVSVKKALKIADNARMQFNELLYEESSARLRMIEKSKGFGIMMLGRPYHSDSYINHKIPEIITDMGVPVLTSDTMKGPDKIDMSYIRPEAYNPFHTELLGAAIFAAKHPQLEAVQLASFGCGHDAILCDEIQRLMGLFGSKRSLVLKIDDGECKGSLSIRIRSFIETVRKKRSI
jgi:predicted CoA-substrate-specific enzyme activase